MSFLFMVGSVGLLVAAPAQQPPEVREVGACVQRVATLAGFSGSGPKQNAPMQTAYWWRDRLNNGIRETLQTRIIVRQDSILVTARQVPDVAADRTLDDTFVTGRQIVKECSRPRVSPAGNATTRSVHPTSRP